MPIGEDENFSFAGYLAEILLTKEVKSAVDSGITEVINLWGEGSTAKKFASKPAKWVINKSFSKRSNGYEEELLSLLKRPDMLEHASLILPGIINIFGEVVHAMALSLESKPTEKQLELISRFFTSINQEKTGKIITSFARTADSLHQKNPQFIADSVIPGLRSFLESTDFSDLKSFLDNSKKDIHSIINGANDLAFEFPAKLVTLLSFIPGISNHVLFFLEDLIKRFNDLPADILADILISFFKETDGKTIGRLLNNLTEMIRQVHTGSALIGEAGAPQFSTELLKKTREIFDETDPVVLTKAVSAILDGKEVFLKTFQTIASENPEFFMGSLETLSDGNNSKIRVLKHKFELIEDLDDEDIARTISAGISKLNTYDFAELLNSACSLFNTINEHSPLELEKLAEEFTSTIDTDELLICLSSITTDTIKSFRPITRLVVPLLIKEVISSLSPEDDGNDELIDEARETLRHFILGREAT
jgi:hypothetical protein